MKRILFLLFLTLILTPVFALAQTSTTGTPKPDETKWFSGQSAWQAAQDPNSAQFQNTVDTSQTQTPQYNQTTDSYEGVYSGQDYYYLDETQNNPNKNDKSGQYKYSCSTSFKGKSIAAIIGFITCVLNKYLIPLVLIFLFVIYIYGNAQYIFNAQNAEELSAQRKFIMWAILVMLLAFSIWGIARLVSGVFGFTAVVPQFQTDGSKLK